MVVCVVAVVVRVVVRKMGPMVRKETGRVGVREDVRWGCGMMVIRREPMGVVLRVRVLIQVLIMGSVMAVGLVRVEACLARPGRCHVGA